MVGIEYGSVFTKVKRPAAELIDLFDNLPVATLHEVMDFKGLLDSEIKPLNFGLHRVGVAVTSFDIHCNNIALHKLLDISQPGDFIVAVEEGMGSGALLGELMALLALAKKVQGVVIDGAIRDTNFLRENRFPVWYRKIWARGTVKNEFGLVNTPVICGGVLINPGDIIVADSDGVIAIPQEHANAVALEAIERERKEVALRNEIKQGKTFYRLMGMDIIPVKEVNKE